VRIGNAAAEQVQLDIYGELLDSAFLYVRNGGRISPDLWKTLHRQVDIAVATWEQPDAGLWEVRGENLHFTHSKAMCWVAVDRGLRIANELGLLADTAAWSAARRRIHAAVVRHGYSDRLQSFVQAFGGEQLDASALRLVQIGFLKRSDPRLRSTIRAIDEQLSSGPLVFRYRSDKTDDGLDSPEGSFIICAFWMADALAIVGELEAAQRRFERLLQFANPLRLFSEEVDATSGGLLGNFPQAFSHLAMISAAVNIERAREHTLGRGRRH
jgi:GH15 family glucan-1,4-alpha-glucosidase